MNQKTTAVISRRDVLRSTSAVALSALVGGAAGCTATAVQRSGMNRDAAEAQITVLYDAFGRASAMEKDWGHAAIIDILAKNAKAKGLDLLLVRFSPGKPSHLRVQQATSPDRRSPSSLSPVIASVRPSK